MVSTLEELSAPLEEYYNNLEGAGNRNPPVQHAKMKKCLLEKYEKDFCDVCEGILMLILDPESWNYLAILPKDTQKVIEDFEPYNSILDHNTTIGEYKDMIMDNLAKLIDGLKKNEEQFYNDVLKSDNPNFLITTYYSLYLRFITITYLKLRKLNVRDPNVKTKDCNKIKDTLKRANLLVALLGMPILIYTRNGEVLPCLSELSGALLHRIVAGRDPIPSNSLGHYLFSKDVAQNRR